jgi:hypothetical protein
MNEILTTILTIVTTLGGWETVKYIIHRKANARKIEAEADSSEFGVLRDTMIFLEQQLKEKEERFAEQTTVVRKLNAENLELTRENAILKAENGLKLCQRRNCGDREPQSGY